MLRSEGNRSMVILLQSPSSYKNWRWKETEAASWVMINLRIKNINKQKNKLSEIKGGTVLAFNQAIHPHNFAIFGFI